MSKPYQALNIPPAANEQKRRDRRARFDHALEDEARADERIAVRRDRAVRRADPATDTVGIVIG